MKNATVTNNSSNFCAVYARTSPVNMAEDETAISIQLRECANYAAQNGLEIVGAYVDPKKSGRRNTKRPQFTAMINAALATNPTFQAIIVFDQSRLFIRTRLSQTTQTQLASNGIQVLSISEAFKPGREPSNGLANDLIANHLPTEQAPTFELHL